MGGVSRLAWLRSLTATCEIDSCRASLALRNFAARKAGIRIGESWYCSSACFQAAAELQFLKLSFQHPGRPASRMPLNLLLMSRGWLTHEQSLAAQKERQRAGLSWSDALLRLGYVTDDQIARALATQAGYPVFSLPGAVDRSSGAVADSGKAAGRTSKAASGATRAGRESSPGRVPAGRLPLEVSIPRALVERYAMLPVHYTPATRRLLVGFVHGVEYGLLYALEQMTGCKAEPCFLTRGDFTAGTHLLDTRSANDELKFEQPFRAAEMAKTVCSYAVQMEADEARFGRTRHYLWARLRSGKQEVDILFGQSSATQPRSRPVLSQIASVSRPFSKAAARAAARSVQPLENEADGDLPGGQDEFPSEKGELPRAQSGSIDAQSGSIDEQGPSPDESPSLDQQGQFSDGSDPPGALLDEQSELPDGLDEQGALLDEQTAFPEEHTERGWNA